MTAFNAPMPLAQLSYGVPVIGPYAYGFTLGLTWAQVLGFDASRRGVIFANPSTDIIYVAPANLAVQSTSGAIPIYPQTELSLFADPPVAMNTAWMAWAATGASEAFTVFDFTDVQLISSTSFNAPQPQTSLRYDVPITSPNTVGVGLGTTSQKVIGANPVRRGISFYNASNTVSIAHLPNRPRERLVLLQDS